jgi:glycosyltransferase involved in cell wall biosynthesis
MDSTISVVIPTYNRLGYLCEALRNALRQTHAATEILVVDDGSTDGTEAAITALPAPVRYFRQKNAGPAAARNRGFREATGDWIALLDSDDLWPPEKLRLQRDFLAKHPATDFVFGNQVNLKNGVQEQRPEILYPGIHRRLRQGGAAVPEFFQLLLEGNPIPTSSVMFRRSCLGPVGFFDEHRWRCEDYEFWFRFARHCQIGFLDEILVAKRSQEDNLINDYAKLWTAHLDVLTALPTKHPDLLLKSSRAWKRAVAETVYRLGSFQLSRGEQAEAVRWFSDLRCADLPPFSETQTLALAKKLLLRLGIGKLACTGVSRH